MAYRRRHSMPRNSTTTSEEPYTPPSLAARAMRASAVHRDSSSIASAYGESAVVVAAADSFVRHKSYTLPKDTSAYEYSSLDNMNESKYGFWGILARKAKSMLDDDTLGRQFENNGRNQEQVVDRAQYPSYRSHESYQNKEGPPFRKSSEALASSLNKFRSALEEGLTMVENKTVDIIQETRKFHSDRRGSSPDMKSLPAQDKPSANDLLPQARTDANAQLAASRDVARKTAAKAKALLRELKIVKTDLAFAKDRCRQLEDENKGLREIREKGNNHEVDDMIRLQLEALLAEKAKLAHENSMYARENRFLREVVEYHQPSMHDVVYLDEEDEDDEDDPNDVQLYTIPIPSPRHPAPGGGARQLPPPANGHTAALLSPDPAATSNGVAGDHCAHLAPPTAEAS